MNVGIAAPLSLAAVNGGVRTQVLQTVHHLRLLGIKAEIIRSDHDHFDFDIVHIFSATPENIGIAKQAKNYGIPLVVSPVFYSKRSARSIAIALKVEQFISKIGTGIHSEYGVKAQLCKLADLLLPNTTKEKALVEQAFGIHESKLKVVPNGVESRFHSATPELFKERYGLEDFILFAGQAGAQRKNVIQLLQVASSIDKEIVIIGDFYEDDYSQKCITLAKKSHNVHLIPTLDHSDPFLESAYAACEIFCLPSLFETPGIAAMEAALAGAKIVITRNGGTKQYFGNEAFYSDPFSEFSLKSSLLKAMQSTKTAKLTTRILERYTWEKVAKQTASEYRTLIS